jgi:hypothetical protein
LHGVFSKYVFISGASIMYKSLEFIQVILISLIGTVGQEVMNSQRDNILPKRIAHHSIPSFVTRVIAAIVGWDVWYPLR